MNQDALYIVVCQVPQQRPVSAQEAARKTAVQQQLQRSTGLLNEMTAHNRRPYGSGGANAGGPSRVSYGQSTQTYGTVSKASLAALQDRQW